MRKLLLGAICTLLLAACDTQSGSRTPVIEEPFAELLGTGPQTQAQAGDLAMSAAISPVGIAGQVLSSPSYSLTLTTPPTSGDDQ